MSSNSGRPEFPLDEAWKPRRPWPTRSSQRYRHRSLVAVGRWRGRPQTIRSRSAGLVGGDRERTKGAAVQLRRPGVASSAREHIRETSSSRCPARAAGSGSRRQGWRAGCRSASVFSRLRSSTAASESNPRSLKGCAVDRVGVEHARGLSRLSEHELETPALALLRDTPARVCAAIRRCPVMNRDEEARIRLRSRQAPSRT